MNENKEVDEEGEAILKKLFQNMKDGVCFHCDVKLTGEKQIGRCVYGIPCGCRLWQGKAREYPLKKEETDD